MWLWWQVECRAGRREGRRASTGERTAGRMDVESKQVGKKKKKKREQKRARPLRRLRMRWQQPPVYVTLGISCLASLLGRTAAVQSQRRSSFSRCCSLFFRRRPSPDSTARPTDRPTRYAPMLRMLRQGKTTSTLAFTALLCTATATALQ